MKSIEGKIVYQRSESDECVCCEGKHIFSKYIDADIHSFIREYALTGEKLEGKTVKISIEIEE